MYIAEQSVCDARQQWIYMSLFYLSFTGYICEAAGVSADGTSVENEKERTYAIILKGIFYRIHSGDGR